MWYRPSSSAPGSSELWRLYKRDRYTFNHSLMSVTNTQTFFFNSKSRDAAHFTSSDTGEGFRAATMRDNHTSGGDVGVSAHTVRNGIHTDVRAVVSAPVDVLREHAPISGPNAAPTVMSAGERDATYHGIFNGKKDVPSMMLLSGTTSAKVIIEIRNFTTGIYLGSIT